MIPLDKIIELIAKALMIPVDLLKSNSRLAHVTDARSLTVYFAKLNKHDDSDILEALCVNYSPGMIPGHLKRVSNLVEVDKKMQRDYMHCSKAIKDYKLDPYARA